MSFLKSLLRNRALALGDVICVIASYFFVFFVCGNSELLIDNGMIMLLTGMIYYVIFYLVGIYRRLWSYGSSKDYLILIASCMCAAFLSICSAYVLRSSGIKMREYVAVNVLCVLGSVSLRTAVRAVDRYIKYSESKNSGNSEKRRVLIYGAGLGAMMFLRETAVSKDFHYNVIGLIDDNPDKKSVLVYGGYKVLGSGDEIKSVCKKYDIDEIIIAIPSAAPEVKNRIVNICSQTGCRIKTLPMLDELIGGKDISTVRSINIEDLLARKPIKLNNTNLNKLIKNKTVVVTGGGGSIGSELCRKIAQYNPGLLVIVDIYENNAYDLQNELKQEYTDLNMAVIIASVRDKQRIDEIFREYQPDIVFHAAAHKHVPLMEDSPSEAIKNNVFGTYNVVNSAMEHHVAKFVMISTDKAVNPTNVMGATKRLCEMIVQSSQGKSKTEFVAVRFGNVLGSNGSVIPLFKKQIEKGGPVTITDKHIIRYFMTIPEAASLVLQAASYAKGGEIFVLDMGEPVKIYDLAVNLIKLSGYTPDVDIKIKEIGLRPGEKLYEELLMNEEGLENTEHDKIFIGKPLGISEEEVMEKLDILKQALETEDNIFIKEAVAKVVPTYKIDRSGMGSVNVEKQPEPAVK